jgi:alkanesulfonate monooxygenase SsuD/methylene tetrahydromethanopterin reductase-like flavin-dependent oxidoreductase (luciferase family)
VSAVRVGCILPGMSLFEASRRRALIELAEQSGLDHLGVGDHVSFVIGAGFDGLLGAAGILSVAERMSTNTAVYLLPLRHPVTVARQLADLAALAPGRFLFGVGVGGEDPHEIEICGVDPATRGRRMDEALQIVTQLMSGRPVDHDGAHFTLQCAQILPAPSVPIPIVVGGRSDAAIQRAGRLGDGWFGIWVSPARYATAVEAMATAAADAGRVAPNWLNALNVWVGVDDDAALAREHVAPAMSTFYGIPYERFERWSPAGTTRQIAEFLEPYAAAGCQVFNLIANGRSREHEIEATAEIRQLLRTAVA